MKQRYITTEVQTQELAHEIASQVKGGEIIALVGDLGAGKTTFTQYFAKALGVNTHIQSPTFVIMRQYTTQRHPAHLLLHLDAYRLSSPDELHDIGLDAHIGQPHAVVVIEWADKLKEYLKNKSCIWVTFEFQENDRVVRIEKI